MPRHRTESRISPFPDEGRAAAAAAVAANPRSRRLPARSGSGRHLRPFGGFDVQ